MESSTHRLFSLVLLASSLFCSSSALSSYSPQDLLAYPKYSISLQNWNFAITNSTATSILSAQSQSVSENGEETDVELHSEGGSDSHLDSRDSGFRNHLMRTVSGKAFLCRVPPMPSSKAKVPRLPSGSTADLSPTGQDDSQNREEKREKMEREGLKRGLELISALKDRCIFTRLGWFTYSFCYGKGEIRQFHAVMVPGHNLPYEDPNQDVYILGFHVDHPHNPHHQARLDGTLPASSAHAAEGELTSLGKNRFKYSSGPTMGLSDVLREDSVLRSEDFGEDEEFGQKMYLVQRWEGGTICDMTGKPRSVEVQFHCSTVATDHIALLRETSICEYLVVIHTPRLCSEPLFLDGGGKKGLSGGDEVSSIQCRPVLSEEEIQTWKTKEEAREKRRTEEAALKQQTIDEETKADEKTLSKENNELKNAQNQEGDKDTTKKHEEEATQASEEVKATLNEPTQLVLDDKSNKATENSEKTHGSDSSSSGKAKGSEARTEEEPKDKQAGSKEDVLEINPITVFFDADTGQMYFDEPKGQSDQGSPPSEGNLNHDSQPANDGQPRKNPSGTDPRDARDVEAEKLAKAIKESLGALLKDLRSTDGRPQNSRTGKKSVSDLLKALKESTGSIRKNRATNKSPTSAKKAVTQEELNLKLSNKKRLSDEHLKMLKMYEGNFDTSDEDSKEKGEKND
ncbi:hypothetical protein BY996DRAFT_4638817 [Phakopsora pachyrhizi]|uniref:Protein OS-9 homolog n=1 Tax=Phakopsora pachyrhizi TaxID=170000 RepID=A0AAV0AFE3_PHAPC|nr:hypothetical protein BY996DRAFT_4638817 [Phakopsora pachyrhizi]CAH7666384.1 hypothetical protein PPACK8108_LOCUS736 [Phakopsora pachyrhizi]